MAIHPVATGSVPAADRAVERTGDAQARKAERQPPSPGEQAVLVQNRQILEAQASISLRSGNQSLTLTLQAAIDAINERLAPQLGENAIERAAESGLDVSPEATAGRIVSLSTAMFSAYQEVHPEMETAEQAQSFVEIIRSGIDQGFAEAREILDGLGVLSDEIAADISRTYELVQEGLNRFLEQFAPPLPEQADEPAPDSASEA